MNTKQVFKCPRCGYDTDRRFCIQQHLSRKELCPAILEDISLHDIYYKNPEFKFKQYTVGKDFECKECHARFTSNSGLSRHKTRYCKIEQNPTMSSRVKQLENQTELLRQHINTLLDANIPKNNTVLNLEQKVKELELALQLTKEDISEKTYQYLLERFRFPGSTHMRLSSGISDITTDTVHAEIKRYDVWKEAVGQLLSFNVSLPRNELHVYLFGKYSVSCKKIAIEHIQKLNIKPFELQLENNTFIIRDVVNNIEQKYDLNPSIS